MRAGRSGRWSRNSPKFWSDVQARNKKCKKFRSPVSFVFSMSGIFFVIPSFNSSWNNSLFIFHLRYYHVWALASLGPSSRASCFSLGLERSKTAAIHIFWEQDNVALDVYAFASPAERSCPFAALNIRIYFVSPLLSRIITLHASKCERGGSMGFYYDSLNTCTSTVVVMPLSRLLF